MSLTSHEDSEGGMECWPLTVGTARTVELSAAPPAGHTLPQGNFLVRVAVGGYCMQTPGIGHLKMSKQLTGNLTQNIPSCGALPQQTAARHVPGCYRLPLGQARLLRPLYALSGYEILRQTDCGL